jgi:hypothetical protein
LSGSGVRAYAPAVGLVVGFVVFMFVAFFIAMSNNQNRGLSGGTWMGSGLLGNGVPARAILLGVASTGSRRSYGGQRFEVRSARVDIEEPGVHPYEIDTQIYIPSNLVRDALPGSTMEVRVDRANPNTVVIVGPDVGYTQGAVRTS